MNKTALTKVSALAAALGVAPLLTPQSTAHAQPPDQAASDQLAQQKPAPWLWNYGVKFVCGEQRVQPGMPGEPPVKPGNYATEINIHNYQWTKNLVRKSVIFLVEKGKPVGREPKQSRPTAFDGIVLQPRYATMDDCNRIWQIAYPGSMPPSPMPLMIGFLVLNSPSEMEVDAVYTAAVPGNPYQDKPTGISIDVERVQGKRVMLPYGALPLAEPVPEGY